MENLSEKYLNLLSEYDTLIEFNDKLKKELSYLKNLPTTPENVGDNRSCETNLEQCSKAYKTLAERKKFLREELKKLYTVWLPPRVHSFFSTIIPWIKKGFKKSKLSDYRFEICKKCDLLTEKNSCLVCGCFMKHKVNMPQASCPIGKWKAEKKVEKSTEPKNS
jgi:hypothetical protein